MTYFLGVVTGVLFITAAAWWYNNVEKRIRALEEKPLFEVEIEDPEGELESKYCLECGRLHEHCDCPGDVLCEANP